MDLRHATEEDFPKLMEMAQAFAKESPYGKFNIQDEKLARHLTHYLTDPNSIVLVYTPNDEVHGMICGTMHEFLFSFEKLASEIVWWVDPEYRTIRSLKLRKGFELWARENGAVYAHMGSPNNPQLTKLLERDGYTVTEITLVKEL